MLRPHSVRILPLSAAHRPNRLIGGIWQVLFGQPFGSFLIIPLLALFPDLHFCFHAIILPGAAWVSGTLRFILFHGIFLIVSRKSHATKFIEARAKLVEMFSVFLGNE